MKTQRLLRFAGCVSLASIVLLILMFLPGRQVHAQAAHAQYDHSNPAANARFPSGQPPTLVQVWFSEHIEADFSQLRVYNAQKSRVDLNNSHMAADSTLELVIALPPHLSDGTYTVVFENVSADDGHHVQGAFSFVVGAGPLPTNTDALLAQSSGPDINFNLWSVVLRWWNYLGMALFTGLLLFLLLIWRPARSRVRRSVGPQLTLASQRAEHGVRVALLVSLALLVVGWAGMLIYQAAIASGSAPWDLLATHVLGEVLFQSRFGFIWLIRAGLLLVAGVCWFGLRQKTGNSPALLLWLLLALSLAIILTTSLDAHAAGSKQAWLLIPVDLIHLASASVWVGGLVALVLILPQSLRTLLPGTGDRTRLLAVILPRFSGVAICSVILLAGTGTLMAVVQLGSWHALFTSTYGQVLLLKLGLFGLLLVLGAFHLLLVSPQMRRFARRTGEENGAAGSLRAGKLQRTFRRTIITECALAILLLGVVGGLTSLSPPPPVTAPAAVGTTAPQSQGKLADLTYQLVINPGVPGPNTFEVVLTQQNGAPLLKVDAVIIRLQALDMGMGIQEIPLQPVTGQAGHYAAVASDLGMGGRWQITLLVRREGFDDSQVSFIKDIG